MPAVTAWLVARPLNAVLGLAALLSLPLLGFLSGAVLVYLLLVQGLRQAIIEATIAGALIMALTAVLGLSLEAKFAIMLTIWLPALLIGVLLARTRSLTLMMQVSVIVAIVGVVTFFAVAGNPAGFWMDVLTQLLADWRASGVEQLEQQAARVEPELEGVAEHMTVWAAFGAWLMAAVMALLGYALYRSRPVATADFGRFRDLDFGRVIAAAMAVASIVAVLTGIAWLQSVAFVIFTIFSLQGVAIVHWWHAEGVIPVFVLVLVYGALVIIVTAPLVVTAMAVLGYIDAWFALRRRRTG